jgi:hypothetical protein
MLHPVQLEGFEGQTIQVQSPGFLSGTKLLVNGQPATQAKQRGQMLLRRNDGREVIATWKSQGLGFDMPSLIVDGKPVEIVPPLMLTQWFWAALPLFLVFVGGALGGITGFIAFAINARVFRTDMNILLKFLVTGLISALAVIIYFIGATLFLAAMGR